MNKIIPLPSSTLDAINTAIQSDPRLVSDHTRRAYRDSLTAFEAWREGRPLTKMLVESYAASLRERYAPATINLHLAAIRWWARKVTDLSADHAGNPQQEALADKIGRAAARILTVKDVTGERLPAGRYLEHAELTALLTACDGDASTSAARDSALLAVAWSTGLRRASLTSLTVDSLELGDLQGETVITWHGKGRKQGRALVTGGAFTRLQIWLDRRGDAPGPLFCQVKSNGEVKAADRLSGEALRLILEKRITMAGIKPCTWHDFRRTFLSNIIDEADLGTAQQLALHATPATTARYDRRPERRRFQAVRATVDVPV